MGLESLFFLNTNDRFGGSGASHALLSAEHFRLTNRNLHY
mgnify:CR=1 FL=1